MSEKILKILYQKGDEYNKRRKEEMNARVELNASRKNLFEFFREVEDDLSKREIHRFMQHINDRQENDTIY